MTTHTLLPRVKIPAATRIIEAPQEQPNGGGPIPSIIRVCDEHAIARVSAFQARNLTNFDLLTLPRNVDDGDARCADCVRAAGYTYEVKLTYFKPSGKFYSIEHALTRHEIVSDIHEELRDRIAAGDNPGLVRHAVVVDGFITLVEVPAHPHGYPKLLVR